MEDNEISTTSIREAGESVETIHMTFKQGWKALHPREDVGLTKKNSSINDAEFDESFYSVDELKMLEPSKSIDKAIDHAATKWEKLDLSFGMNRRKKQGSGGPGKKKDFRFTELPEGFDIWQPMDKEMFQNAVQSQLKYENRKGLNIESDDEDDDDDDDDDEMISFMDNDQYKQKLTDIFKSVPSHLDLNSSVSDVNMNESGSSNNGSSSNSSSNMANSDSNRFEASFQMRLAQAMKVVDESASLSTVKELKRPCCLLANDIFRSNNSTLNAKSDISYNQSVELIQDRLMFDINVYSTKRCIVKTKKKSGAKKSGKSSGNDAGKEDEDENSSSIDKEMNNDSSYTYQKQVHTQSITVYSDTLLTQFVEVIRCPCENLYAVRQKDRSTESAEVVDGTLCDTVLVIGACAYVSEDISDEAPFIQFLQKRLSSSSSSSSSSSLKIENIEGVHFGELSDVKLNEPCLFYHFGDCVHQISVSDIYLQFIPFEYRLQNQIDSSQSKGSKKSRKVKSQSQNALSNSTGGVVDTHEFDNIPIQTALNVEQKQTCMGCMISSAAYVCYQDPLLGSHHKGSKGSEEDDEEDIAVVEQGTLRLCEVCHFALHYSPDGQLLPKYRENENFRIFPYIPPGY